jgi:hypothetical protein
MEMNRLVATLMIVMRQKFLIVCAVAALALFAVMKLRAGRNRVTLNMRNAPLREVTEAIRKQTGIPIYVHKDIDASITLNVKARPVDEVLGLITDQANASWASMFALYSKEASVRELRKWLEGEHGTVMPEWKSFQDSFGPERRIVYTPEKGEAANPARFDVHFNGKKASAAARMLSNLGGAHVILENNRTEPITLHLKQTVLAQAVDRLAGTLGLHSAHFFTVQRQPHLSIRIGGDDPEEFMSRKPLEHAPPPNGEGLRMVRRGAPNPQERQKMERLVNSTPEERREILAADMKARTADRMTDSLKNHTPEQRIDRIRNGRGGEGHAEISERSSQ